MDPCIKITKKFTKKFGSKVINRQYFHRKTGLKCFLTFSLEFPSASVPKKKLMANHPPRWTRQKWKLPKKNPSRNTML